MCHVGGCTLGEYGEDGSVFKTGEDLKTLDQAMEIMKLHVRCHELSVAAMTLTPPAFQGQNQSRIPKSISPKVEMGITSQEWEYFLGDWK